MIYVIIIIAACPLSTWLRHRERYTSSSLVIIATGLVALTVLIRDDAPLSLSVSLGSLISALSVLVVMRHVRDRGDKGAR